MANHRSRYYIVKARSRKELIQKVEDKLEGGWFPTGGLAVYTEYETNEEEVYYFVQAMVWEK